MAWFTVNSQIFAEEPVKPPAKTEEKKEGDAKVDGKEAEQLIKLAQDREELVMPGLKIMIKKGYIDVDAKV